MAARRMVRSNPVFPLVPAPQASAPPPAAGVPVVRRSTAARKR